MAASAGRRRKEKGREVDRGRMQGAGLPSVTSLRLREGRPSFLLPPSSPPIHVALTTASSLAQRGWGRDHARLCRSPAGLHDNRRRWRERCENARARYATGPTGGRRARVNHAIENILQALANDSRFPQPFRARGCF